MHSHLCSCFAGSYEELQLEMFKNTQRIDTILSQRSVPRVARTCATSPRRLTAVRLDTGNGVPESASVSARESQLHAGGSASHTVSLFLEFSKFSKYSRNLLIPPGFAKDFESVPQAFVGFMQNLTCLFSSLSISLSPSLCSR